MCLMLSKKDQLDLYFDYIVSTVDDEDVLIQWIDAVECENNISSEVIETYKLKLSCKDLDMKTEQWKQKMIRNTLQIIQNEERFNYIV